MIILAPFTDPFGTVRIVRWHWNSATGRFSR